MHTVCVCCFIIITHTFSLSMEKMEACLSGCVMWQAAEMIINHVIWDVERTYLYTRASWSSAFHPIPYGMPKRRRITTTGVPKEPLLCLWSCISQDGYSSKSSMRVSEWMSESSHLWKNMMMITPSFFLLLLHLFPQFFSVHKVSSDGEHPSILRQTLFSPSGF